MTVPITVYIPCHDYADFVDRAIVSVLDQTYDDWDLIVVDDGSTDGSRKAIAKYDGNERLTILHNERPLGLRAVANQCIAAARGTHVLRLDADDRLHPHCLEALARAAAASPETAIFFSDYFYVDDADNVIGVECLPTSDAGYEATTFPPHGACSLIRKDVLDELGGYDDDVARQDGHEVWLKLLRSGHRFEHVALPLFYYRRHGDSLSTDISGLLEDRGTIMRRLAAGIDSDARVIAVVPVKNTYAAMPGIPFRRVGGVTLLDLAIREAYNVEAVDEVVVTSDADDVVEHVREHWPAAHALRRPEELTRPTTTIADVLRHVVEERGLDDDAIIVLLSVHTPRRTAAHVQKALDAFHLYGVDSVVSVYEERSLLYQMGQHGLRPLNPSNEGRVRLERDATYVDTGAVRVLPVRNIRAGTLLGSRIGHALMDVEDSIQIKSPRDFVHLDPVDVTSDVAP
ncbi:MAG TPA: glycosyltransferase [Gaiellaceae bacterium]|nr:glycosyltransferase [Gaiellaceae bacterium]